jgi:hypothetical protein
VTPLTPTRIGARRFRAKRKGECTANVYTIPCLTSFSDYVSNIEATLRAKEDECSALRNQVDAQRNEINDLRHRLGLPILPAPDTALGLVVPNNDGWHDGLAKDERKD